jgi:hypothetical protein
MKETKKNREQQNLTDEMTEMLYCRGRQSCQDRRLEK